MKRKDKIKNLSGIILILALIFLFLGLCSCNTQKRIMLTDQKITFQVDTNIQVTPKTKPIEKQKSPKKLLEKYDTIKIYTDYANVITYYDTAYNKIKTRLMPNTFNLDIVMNKTIKTKTKEKIKEKQFSWFAKFVFGFWICFMICWIIWSVYKIKNK